MEGKAFADLVDDIKANGLREPIWLLGSDSIIDGRNRFRACTAAGVEPRFSTYIGPESGLVGFVVSLNLHRRHLDESQRALVAAKIANLGNGQRKSAPSIEGGVSQPEAAALLNVGVASVERAAKVVRQAAPELVHAVESGAVSVSAAAQIADAPQETQRELVARGEREILKAAKEIRAQRQEVRRAERTEKLAQIATGNKPLSTPTAFPVILADPPWRYEHAESESRAIENQYPTMSIDDICALPVASIATPDAVLFMWATSPKLEEAFRVLSAWGFGYRTCMVWVKDKIGMGYYARQQHELLLIAVRGAPPTPEPAVRPSSVFHGERTQHSAKPEIAHTMIERMYPTLPRIELFCRQPRQGWSAWGNQAEAA